MTVGQQHRPGRAVAVPAPPVRAAPPTLAELVARGTRLGLGVAGLARDALLVAVARTSAPAAPAADTGGRIATMVPGAAVGLGIVAERRIRGAVIAAVEGVAAVSQRAARGAARVPVVERRLDALENRLWRWNQVARREQQHNRVEAATALPVLVQRITETVVAHIDFERVVDQIPVDRLCDSVVARLDIEAIVSRLDLAAIIRESTFGVTAEAVDAVRVQAMSLDAVVARCVDRALLRRRPRDLDLGTEPVPDAP
jgi:hypothetical protein